MDQSTITLSVGAMGNVQVTIIVPGDALGEVHTITVKLQTEDGEDLDSFDVPIRVEWMPGLSVTVDGTTNRNMTRGSELTYVLWVSNTGNRQDDVRVEFSGLIPGLLADATPSTLSLAIGDRKSISVLFNATPLTELKRGTIGVVFIFGEDLERVTAFVNITVEIVPVTTDPTNGDDDDDGGGLSRGLIMGIIIAVVLVVVIVGLMMFTRTRRSSHKLEEGFFVGQGEDRRTAEVLKVEQEAAPRRAPPRPPSHDEGAPAAIAPAAIAPAAPVASAAPQEAPAGGGSCPECGNPMQALSPPESGSYCPMCGHRTGGV